MSGWIVIDKPIGMSSAQVVGKVKWLLQLKKSKTKIGHAGTLDPLATGILPLAIGEATKVIQFLLDSDKRYEFEITWGQERDTDDAEGAIVSTSDLQVSSDDIEKAMNEFRGKISQMPPQYSALKLDGKKAYELAREGKEAKLKARDIEIYSIKTLPPYRGELEGGEAQTIGSPIPPPSLPPRGGGIVAKSSFAVHCSKGTYIRSIARDMGRKLGCYGYVSKLHRVGHGKFDIKQAISLENFINMCEKGIEQQAILPVDEILDDIPELKLPSDEAQQVRNGIVLNKDMSDCDLIRIYHDNTLLAIAEIKDRKLKTKRVFNL